MEGYSLMKMTSFDSDNERLFKKISDLLLSSGYYRVRLTNLLPFDKILGGLAWGISATCYPLEIDLWLAYSEYATMGLKLQVAEGVCSALKEMKCPRLLQPHQITGLDFGVLLPVVEWLMTKVEEARTIMGDTLRNYAEFVYKKFYKPEELVVVYRMEESSNDQKINSIVDEDETKQLEEEVIQKRKELETLKEKKDKAEKYFKGMRSTVEALEAEKEEIEEQINEIQSTEKEEAKEEQEIVIKANEVEEVKEEIRKFKEDCKVKHDYYIETINTIKSSIEDKDKLAAIEKIETQHQKEMAKIELLEHALGERKRNLKHIEKEIDAVPGKFELQQYQKQLIYLSIQTSVTLVDTRYYYEMYNYMTEVKELYKGELNNLENITKGMDGVKNNKTLQSLLESIIKANNSLEGMIIKEQKSLRQSEENSQNISIKLQEISRKETEFYELVKKFEDEISLNEKIEAKIQELQFKKSQQMIREDN
ncbi:hypothetical protein EHI8A_012620 [Entamoeba histolytica HM-1:IMSS-B]|uniref:Uncharacterized protein n=6 Tax=Entamoeba histolytica TaxID=5759 RepID=C4LY75_ENTH1|nr:hypothetical protein, conserved [Entamoeba histolytica HM-1:IMSS]EMD47427.1 rho/RAC guanine nucleotide exchange factor, putative [Entamoeba histolytica KU27]EMH78045.1 hypothetical protein EHI8A_012620 [Entamoeba histolytica HM-1:IMSS-B]EMS13501.1 Rho/RAC guanine nucleotide exchange factor, putative [Entamoeba histolytica HM-3:IMSS]ENY62254.1 Rho/RAC guanine nucleotide exchange factor, putative [Entamoeba histolytica HM-1:IMSS-A]GAT93749.1 hypothetical protein conserved [Entamoeba histolyti|eukprot:XP_653389.1 hypothetical protein, conserved [Entamoeba histolytica HM-1:IMSS]